MKKLLFSLSSTLQGGLRGGLLILTLLATTSLWAYDFQSGDLYYNITSDSTVEVTEGNYSGEIIIPETVTYNGIAYSVTSIGYGAFDYCSSLTSVTIGNSVTSIGNRAFEKCSSLTSITIPNSVTSIGEYAFRRSSLFSITIPNNVTSIGTLAFDCSSLTSVVWNATNYTSSAQYRFNNAIDSSQITSFTFGDSVKHIPAYLCGGIENLQSVVIPNSVTSIGEGTFYGCSSLTSITIPNSVTSVGSRAFESCYSLTSITIPNSITSIKERTFYGCSSLTSITIPNSVTNIGNSAFYGCSSITSITIPENVTSIGIDAFSNCSSLTSVIWNVINYQSSALSAFSDDVSTQITSFIFGDSVKFIPSYLCANMSALTSIIIPNGVDSIGQAVFGNCKELSSIVVDENNSKYDSRDNCNAIIETETNIIIAGCKTTVIPTSIATIGDYAFYNSLWLTSLVIPNTITTIGNYAFKDCTNLTSITIPNSVTTIGNYSFQNCVGITSVTIPSSVTKIKYGPFAGCVALSSIIVDKNNTTFDSRENCNAIIETETNTLIAGCKNTIIPNGVTCLQYGAFYDCKDLTSIQLPNTITTIENDVFRGCSQLTSIAIPSSVSSIERQPFWECYALSSISVDSDNPTYDSRNNCNAIIETSTNTLIAGCPTTIIPTSVTSIGSGAFQTQHHLTSITIPNGVTNIGYSAFDNCHNLTSVTMGNTITNIEDYAFWMCYSLDTMKCYTAVPPKCTNSSFLMGTPSTVYVPCSSLEAYKSHEIWGEFNIQCLEDLTPSEPQDTTIYLPIVYETICEGTTFVWMGMEFTAAGMFISEEIVEDENYIYHYIYTLELTVIPFSSDTIVVEAYDSYEWHGKVYTESGTYIYENFCSIEVLELTIIDTPTPPEPEIPTEGIGVFSIGEGKTVTFSRGNLQYTQSTNTWSFASAQWEMIGTDNVTGGSVSSDPTYGDKKYGDALADKVDLFGWSTGATNFGVSTSTDWENDYLGSFVDWGRNKIGNDAPNTWRTLTHDEWYYLRYNRTNADNLVGVAQVNGVKGLVFLPDTWICPEGVTFKSGFSSDYSVEAYGQYQTFTAKQWSVLESVGAVFLPAAGLRNGSFMERVQGNGYYWSASGYNSYYADYLYFYSDRAGMSGYYRDNGQSVRLVKDVNSTTPEPPVEPETEEIFIYQPVDSVTICEWELPYIWRGMYCTEAGTYTHEEIVEDENYIYHYIHTLALQVLPSSIETIVVEAYDSYEWHGKVYTESGVYTYRDPYNPCIIEELYLTIIPSEEKEYVHYYYNDIFVCDGDTYEDPITGIYHLIVEHTTWSDTITGTEVDTIYTFNITPIVAPEPLTEDILYAIGAVPELVAGEMVNTMGTTEPIMWYYQMNDKDDIADVIGVEWVAGHDVVLNTEQTTHTMVLEVWDECYNTRSMKFTFPVSKKDSAPQDTTIYHPTVYETICEGTTFTWMGMDCTEAGLYEYHEIVEGEDYTYHHIYTLELTILPYKRVEYEMIAYDSYEWHGWVYTESGTHTYQSDECTTEVLYLTIIPSGHNQGEVVVEPSTNSVTITWQKEESADSYIIVIKQGDKVICTLIFDAEGNLVSVNYLPGREGNQHGIQYAGQMGESFQYTITGLASSTTYTYTVTAIDDSDNTINTYSGEFTTHNATSVENTHSQSPMTTVHKFLRDGQLYIYHNGSAYTIMGQKVSENF